MDVAHYPVNEKLETYRPRQGYRFEMERPTAEKNTRSLFVALCFSGGGTRASAFSYGLLDKLRKVKINWKGRTKSLLDEVDVISSVSGGSFTAAYYGLYGREIFRNHGEKYRQDFLDRNITAELLLDLAFNPATWWALSSSHYSRSDLAAELYDETIFDGRTYRDLARRGGPFVIINATNIYDGNRFEFTQDGFDFLGSDLSSFPLGRAVAASSAFPGGFTPIILRNYPFHRAKWSIQDEVLLTPPGWEGKKGFPRWTDHLHEYLHPFRHTYLHLMDGGIVDNTGIPAVYDLYRDQILSAVKKGQVEKFLLIVVDSNVNPRLPVNHLSTAPDFGGEVGIVELFKQIAYTIFYKYGETSARLFQKLIKAGRKETGNRDQYVVRLTFNHHPQAKRLNRIKIDLDLDEGDREVLVRAAADLLENHREFGRFLKGLR